MVVEREQATGWVLEVEGFDIQQQRVHNALFALAGCGIGTSGRSLLTSSATRRWVLVAGVYDGRGPETHLLLGPALTGLEVDQSDERLRRRFDLRSGVLSEDVDRGDGVITMSRFVSCRRPGIVAVRTRFPDGVTRGPARLESVDARVVDSGSLPSGSYMRVAGTAGGIAVAVHERRDPPVVDDLAAVIGSSDSLPARETVERELQRAAEAGFDRLLEEHRAAWAARWDDADIEIVGDDELQLATRFALFQLMANVGDEGEAAVGARGVSGSGYRGHVFWDADAFVLPFFAATHPATARAMLEYRIRRLPAARAEARARHHAGARFPWESADTGREVTPPSAIDRAGNRVLIRTGDLEDHIVADVAWAANEYIQWTGDDVFAAGPGLTLLVETARYWASRIRSERDGTAHIYGVIGPDEYHEPVDDNAFTNVMARWNLRTAAAAVERRADARVDPVEVTAWRDLADALVDGFDPVTRRYEQFAGFAGLEPLLIAEIAPRRPIAADLLLGAARVRGAQIIKQADVLMLHHLVPGEVEPGSLEPNLAYYEPRTAHGSSLSPAIHAALFARAGDVPRALEALRVASRIDLDDLTGSTAEGLHLATMGGLWQAFAMGFAGLRAVAGRLRIDPYVPPTWESCTVRVRFHGARVQIRMEAEHMTVTADAPVALELGSRQLTLDTAGAQHLRRTNGGWELA